MMPSISIVISTLPNFQIDAQSVKNTDTAEEKGYDAGKKVSGIKRHFSLKFWRLRSISLRTELCLAVPAGRYKGVPFS
jgi:hypothetical protein